MAAARPRRTGAERFVSVLTWTVTLSVSAIALLFVVAAGLFYLRYDEPDPELAKRFAAAVRAADGRVDLAQVYGSRWDTVSIFGPFTDLAAVRRCLGVDDWDQDGALADRLARDNQAALVFVTDGAVTAATWSVWQEIAFEVPENLCAVPRAEAVFPVATRVENDAKAGRVTVYRLARDG